MKIAITSTGNTLDSNMDQRFGRCSYFVVYNMESKSVEYIPTQTKNYQEVQDLHRYNY